MYFEQNMIDTNWGREPDCCCKIIPSYAVTQSETKPSAYRKGHSTETALLRSHNDLLTGADSHRASCLVMLDLSAALDTVDHNILLTCLSDNVGLTLACL